MDIAAGEYIGDKTPEKSIAIYELLSSNSQQKTVRGRIVFVHEMSTLAELGSQVTELSHQVQVLSHCITQPQDPYSYGAYGV